MESIFLGQRLSMVCLFHHQQDRLLTNGTQFRLQPSFKSLPSLDYWNGTQRQVVPITCGEANPENSLTSLITKEFFPILSRLTYMIHWVFPEGKLMHRKKKVLSRS